jgi:hypothetical protein
MIQLQLQEPMILQILGIPPVPMVCLRAPTGPATPETKTPDKKPRSTATQFTVFARRYAPQMQGAYDQMKGANPTNNKRSNQ